MDRLTGKVALVTGGAKGLGESDARLMAAEGARVIIADIDDAAGESLVADIGASASYVRLDVGDEAQWAALVREIEQTHGRLDILVNNAGIAEIGTPLEIDAISLRKVMDVSLNGTIWGCKHAIPLMARGGGGSIVNMASIAAAQGLPRVAAYTAAKGAIEAYTRCVAVFCAQKKLNIRCNAVLPDRIETSMVREMAQKSLRADQDLSDNAPGVGDNDRGAPDDVGHLVVYLASDESRFISGQAFIIDNTSSITKGHVPQ